MMLKISFKRKIHSGRFNADGSDAPAGTGWCGAQEHFVFRSILVNVVTKYLMAHQRIQYFVPAVAQMKIISTRLLDLAYADTSSMPHWYKPKMGRKRKGENVIEKQMFERILAECNW
eukprot:GILI01070006.1.p1 GENE.GILI01070006.1~~GILI01070006.1.p1  ORF type:complete len:117 (-),score=0.28 GILI01070006.1:44-394(-)